MPDDARPAGGSPALAEHEQLTRLGKYVIERKLGSGGMGTVFLAKDSDLKRTVALKVLAKDRAENPVLVRRFKAEGQAAAYLQHKNIVGVYDSGQIDGFLYIALEFVEGQDVLEIIRKRGVIPVKRSIEIIKQVAEALQHAYEKQIVHRDIKPSNLLIKNDGTVKLADLGLARSIDETLDTSITRVGTTVGTVDYMSPEQARNSKATDIRSDIYSLGCTWYHMLTGVPPYGEGSVTNKLQAHASAPIPDPRSRNERIPEGVVAVLHRMMAKQAKDRYQTPAELLEDLNNPGISRSGLNADVLAALAQPGTTPRPESSSGDIFEARPAFDSADIEISASSVRQDALPESVIFDDDDVEDDAPHADSRSAKSSSRRQRPPEPTSRKNGSPNRTDFDDDDDEDEASAADPANPAARKRRPAKPPESDRPRGKAPPREERNEADDHQIPTRQKPRPSSGDPGKSGPLPRRQSTAEREAQSVAAEEAKERFKKRKLPPRASDVPLESEPVRMSLDPDRIKAIVLGGAVIAILAGVAYAFSRMGGDTTASPAGAGDATAAAGSPDAQQPVVDPKQQAAPPDEQSSTKTAAVPGEPSDASTPARKSAEPIAGAEDLKDLNSVAAREFIPNWLFQVRRHAPAEVKPIVVRRPAESAHDGVATFADALAKLPPGPAIIEFEGNGPFRIHHTSLPARSDVVLRAASGSHPVLVMNSGELKPGEACLKSEGSLTFRGVHLVFAAAAGGPADIAMVQGASLAFRDCTLQSAGPGASGAALVAVDATPHAATGAVFENCHLRSLNGDGVRLTDASAKILAGNSLLCFENGRALISTVTSNAPSGAGEVTLLRSTILCGAPAISMLHEGKTLPLPFTIALRDSNVVAAKPDAILLDLKGWPASEASLSDKPTAVGLAWKSERSAIAGFNEVARMSPAGAGPAANFEGDAGWQKFWRQQPAGTRLAPSVQGLPPQWGDADPSALAAAGPHREMEPGCRLIALPSAPNPLIDRVRALASIRRLPDDFIAFRKPSTTVKFDLSKPGTLNAFLNDSSKVPDNALVQLEGIGIRAIPAITIQNRVLHLEFVQLDGAPLVVRPQPGHPTDALISIDGGAVSISNARLLLPDSDRQNFPPSLIKATNAGLSLTNCTLSGAGDESNRPGPLVRWKAGDPAQGLLLHSTCLTGGHSAVEAELGGGMLEIDNSILASVTDALALKAVGANRPGDVTITSSTLGSGSSILSVGPLPAGEGPALTVVVADCVAFATPAAAGKTAMLRLATKDDQHRIGWWEDSVGYSSSQIPALAAATGDVPQLPWADRWGPGHVLHVCSSERAVLFESPLENLAKTDLASFRLNPRCLSAAWSATGGPLGATGPSLGAPIETRTPQSPEKGQGKPPVQMPNRPRSVF